MTNLISFWNRLFSTSKAKGTRSHMRQKKNHFIFIVNHFPEVLLHFGSPYIYWAPEKRADWVKFNSSLSCEMRTSIARTRARGSTLHCISRKQWKLSLPKSLAHVHTTENTNTLKVLFYWSHFWKQRTEGKKPSFAPWQLVRLNLRLTRKLMLSPAWLVQTQSENCVACETHASIVT